METFSALLALCVGNSPVTGERRALMFLWSATEWINCSVNNREAGDLRHHRTHYDVTVMICRGYKNNNFSHYALGYKPFVVHRVVEKILKFNLDQSFLLFLLFLFCCFWTRTLFLVFRQVRRYRVKVVILLLFVIVYAQLCMDQFWKKWSMFTSLIHRSLSAKLQYLNC